MYESQSAAGISDSKIKLDCVHTITRLYWGLKYIEVLCIYKQGIALIKLRHVEEEVKR